MDGHLFIGALVLFFVGMTLGFSIRHDSGIEKNQKEVEKL